MTVHKIEPSTIPDMQAVREHAEMALDRLETLIQTMKLVHHVDQDLLTGAECSLQATRRALLLSMRGRDV